MNSYLKGYTTYREQLLGNILDMQPPEVAALINSQQQQPAQQQQQQQPQQNQQQQQEQHQRNVQQLAAAAAAAAIPQMMSGSMPQIALANAAAISMAQTPIGLRSLLDRCLKVYPGQVNPLQVSTLVKFWLGGPDPLDYISMYSNEGDTKTGIPPHWHYVSFGLSDLHGDGRVHPLTDITTPSGFGFELTFRLKKNSDELSPPTWPAAVMQALAKYVFQTENILCEGDHVSWHCPLDSSDSRIHHMLMTKDSQLQQTVTPFGPVTFIQIVGVCAEELHAAQQWNGAGIINLMRSFPQAGGPMLVTDMRRGETIFELDPDIREKVDEGISEEGSNLSGVSAKFSYSTSLPKNATANASNKKDGEVEDNEDNEEGSSLVQRPNIDRELESGQSRHSAMSVSHDRNSQMSFTSETEVGNNELMELSTATYFDSIALTFNFEAGSLLPLVLRGRLQHGRHFTYKSIDGDLAITFLTASVSGSVFVGYEQPYGKLGQWMQILLQEEYILKMLEDLDNIKNIDKKKLPVTYKWEDINFAITLVPDE